MNPDKMWQDIDDALAAGGADRLLPRLTPPPSAYGDALSERGDPRDDWTSSGLTAERYYADAVSTKRRARLELLVPLRHGKEWASGIAAHVLSVVRGHVEGYEGGEVTRSKDGRFLQIVFFWPHVGPPPAGEPLWFAEHIRLPVSNRQWPGVRAALTYQRAVEG